MGTKPGYEATKGCEPGSKLMLRLCIQFEWVGNGWDALRFCLSFDRKAWEDFTHETMPL